jgi:hypothetical protein
MGIDYIGEKRPMTSFNDREKGFENKFAKDAETQFKINARRNSLLGLWAAEKLGKSGDGAATYAKDVVMADLEESNHRALLAKILKDFKTAGISISGADIEEQMKRLRPLAEKQITETK